MDHHAVPFPTLTEMSTEKIRDGHSSHSRVNSSPTLPNVWLPQFGQPHSRARPHLRPLDLAASPTLSHKSSSASLSHSLFANANGGSPRRSGPLLTPPLTPSSSFTSSATTVSSAGGERDRDVVPSTPPDGGSPFRWGALKHSQSQRRVHSRSGYFTPPTSKDEVDLGEVGIGVGSGVGGPTLAELSARFEKMEVEDGTPRVEKTMSWDQLELESGENEKNATLNALEDLLDGDDGDMTRFLLVRNIPQTTPTNVLRTAFGTKEIKGILVRFQESHGAVFLAYYDVREAVRARRALHGKTFADLCGDRIASEEGKSMAVRGLSAKGMEMIIGQSTFVAEMDGSFLVSVENRVVQPADMQQLLGSFGEIMSFGTVSSEGQTQAFRVEYYDVRQRDTAFAHLNNRTMFGARLRLSADPLQPGPSFSAEVDLASPPRSPTRIHIPLPDTPSPVRRRDIEIAAEFRLRPRSVSASENMGCPDAVRKLRRGREGSSPSESGSRSPNRLFFDPIDKVPVPPLSPDRQRSISMGPEGVARFDGYASHPMPGDYYRPDYMPVHGYPYSAYDYAGYPYPHAQAPWTYGRDYDYYASSATSSRQLYLGQGYDYPTPRRTLHERQSRRLHTYSDAESRYEDSLESGTHAVNGTGGGNGEPPSKNQLDLAAIENGMDTRTTVMVKNIPNKMTDKDLLTFINKVCPRRIDFLYLRMDFQNGCNVGYAFVNFITVQDLLQFARTQLGVKWNMYSSEKVLQMSYANYQGKEALVEKFKNSCIMDEREAWRPKIFYSDGPNQGLPEPFPPPTHLRRKERSASNRGALFVPGAHHYAAYHGNGHSTDAPQGWRHHAPRFNSNFHRHGQASSPSANTLYVNKS